MGAHWSIRCRCKTETQAQEEKMKPNLSLAVASAAVAVREAAIVVREILEGGITVEVEAASIHSLKTLADKESQRVAVDLLRRLYTGAKFFGEEDDAHARESDVLTADQLLTASGIVYIEDTFHGTAQGARGRAGWSTVVNVMEGGRHTGAVVVAPEWKGGIEVVGELGRGVWKRERGSSVFVPACVSATTAPKSAFVLFGIDTPKRPGLSALLQQGGEGRADGRRRRFVRPRRGRGGFGPRGRARSAAPACVGLGHGGTHPGSGRQGRVLPLPGERREGRRAGRTDGGRRDPGRGELRPPQDHGVHRRSARHRGLPGRRTPEELAGVTRQQLVFRHSAPTCLPVGKRTSRRCVPYLHTSGKAGVWSQRAPHVRQNNTLEYFIALC